MKKLILVGIFIVQVESLIFSAQMAKALSHVKKIRDAINALTPTKEEKYKTMRILYNQNIQAYAPNMPMMKYLSDNEIQRQLQELEKSIQLLNGYGFIELTQEEIEDIVRREGENVSKRLEKNDQLDVALSDDTSIPKKIVTPKQTSQKKYKVKEITNPSEALSIFGFTDDIQVTIDDIEEQFSLLQFDHDIGNIDDEFFGLAEKSYNYLKALNDRKNMAQSASAAASSVPAGATAANTSDSVARLTPLTIEEALRIFAYNIIPNEALSLDARYQLSLEKLSNKQFKNQRIDEAYRLLLEHFSTSSKKVNDPKDYN